MNKSVDLVFKNYTNSKAPRQSFFKKILEITARELKLKGPDFSLKNRGSSILYPRSGQNRDKISVSVNLTGEGKIQELNRKYRKKNCVTDVLSFPLLSGFKIQNSKFKIQDLGDIFICLSIAKKEAKRENISTERKLAQLTVHGFLHLLGYGHEHSHESAKKMFRIESQILKKLNSYLKP